MSQSQVLSRRVVHKDQIIFREGEPGNVMFLVQSGHVLIWRGEPDVATVIRLTVGSSVGLTVRLSRL